MAWSLIAHTIKTRATTNAINTTGADFIVISVASYSTTPITVSDSQSNTWSPRTEKATGNDHVRLFYCQAPTTNSAHTFSTNADFYEIAVQAWSGSTSTPFDVENGATGPNATLQTGSITPSVNNELIVSAVGQSADGATGTQTWTVDSSLTISDQVSALGGQHTGLAFGYFAQTTAAAINPTWTLSSTANQAAVIASFKPAAGGGITTINAGLGAYTYNGKASPLSIMLGAKLGTYTYAGLASTLGGAVIVNAGLGAYTYAGKASPLSLMIGAKIGAYTYAGKVSPLVPMFGAKVGAYTYQGIKASLGTGGVARNNISGFRIIKWFF